MNATMNLAFKEKGEPSEVETVPNHSQPSRTLRPLLLLLSLIIVLHFPAPASCLRVRDVTVPGYSAKGDAVEMDCRYDLEGDQLYSVKWYKGFREFFRYVPADSPQIQVFDVPGVHVDVARSTPSRIILKKVSRKSSGKYKCEVSAEAPSFHTDSGAGELLVADLPDSVPSISGLQKRYHVGDIVHVNCTSYRSKPAAALSWYINGKKADQSYLIEYAPIRAGDGLETSTLGLRFLTRPQHLRHGELKLRCTATIASVFFKQSIVRIRGHLTRRRGGPYRDQLGLHVSQQPETFDSSPSLPDEPSPLSFDKIRRFVLLLHLLGRAFIH